MKRRNFLSGLLAGSETPTAKRAWATICAEPRLDPERDLPAMKLLDSLVRGQNLRVAFAALGIINYQPAGYQPAHCSLPRGHKGPHALLNSR